MFTIAIIGRPNVGKSTLFNKLVGKSIAIVNDYAGVTRDRKDAIGYLGPLEFKIIDTAGWGNNISKDKLEHRMVEQTEIAIKEADLCLFVVDKKNGINNIDLAFAEKLRKINTPTVLIVNKCDNNRDNYGFDKEFYKLGFDKMVGISAEHNNGFNNLYDAIEPYYDEYQKKIKDLEEVNSVDVNNEIVNKEQNKPLQVAIVGRPNSGKSTLINQLLGYERVITGPEAGITRDSIAIDWEYNGKKIKLIDTAGIRKRRNIDEELEKISVDESMHAIDFAQVVIMMIDATSPFDSQDLSILSMLVKEGRGVVFALNKWDKIENKQELIKHSILLIEKNIPELKGCPIIPISALNGNNIDKLMNAVFKVFKAWDSHISTAKLNQWLKIVENEHTPPLFKGNNTKLKYITQAKKRPPTFVLFTNSPERLKSTNYDRFLVNRIREDFNLRDTIVRILLRKTDNPYKDKIDGRHLRNKLNTKNSRRKK